LLGVFYILRAPALIDDLPIDHEYWERTAHDWKYIKELYFDSAVTCFIAMGCYMFTFTVSIIMLFVNKLMK